MGLVMGLELGPRSRPLPRHEDGLWYKAGRTTDWSNLKLDGGKN